MYPTAVRQAALDLVAGGESDCEVARRLGIPRSTVRDWRRRPPPGVPRGALPALLAPRLGDHLHRRGLRRAARPLPRRRHITALARTERLRLSLDARYPGIVTESEALLRRSFPSNRVGRVLADGGATVVLWVYSRHLSCLFPQDGPGKKHERRIELEPWQRQLVDAAPWAFLRGCIRSDGCCFINRTGRYEYLTYHFGNCRRTSGNCSSTCAAPWESSAA